MKSTVKGLCLALLLCVALGALCGCTASEQSRYEDAQALMAQGKYAEAAEKFTALGSYEESGRYAAFCKAMDAGERGDYEAAVNGFRELDGFKDSTGLLNYYSARVLEAGSWQDKLEAARMFGENSKLLDSAARAENCRSAVYAEAMGLKEAGDFDGACGMLEALGDYSDAAAQVSAVRYTQAEALEAEGRTEEASALFAALGDYSDAQTRAYKPYYDEGVAKRAAGDWDGAAAAFEKAGNYSDAPLQISATRYAQAEALEAEGRQDEASALFAGLGSYNDAQVRAYKPYYQEGMAKREAGDWDGAAAAFEKAGNYSDAAIQVKETRYLQAGSLRAEGRLDEAAAVYGEVRGYKDVDSILEALFVTETAEAEQEQTQEPVQEAEQEPAQAQTQEPAQEPAQEAEQEQAQAQTQEPAQEAEQEQAQEQVQEPAQEQAPVWTVGSVVTFGTYPQTAEGTDSTPIEWIVLDVQENQVLLISKYGLDAKPYHRKYSSVTWDVCSLRAWLNEDFLNAAFSEGERAGILTTTVDNSKKQRFSRWDTRGGGNTEDRIFLLSYAEAKKYFGVTLNDTRNTQARVEPTAYALAQGATVKEDKLTEEGKAASWWWLRSPGNKQYNAAYVNQGGSLSHRSATSETVCVRPALWLDLNAEGVEP